MTPKEFSEITSHAWQYVLSPFRRPVPTRTYATERSLLSSKAFRWGNGGESGRRRTRFRSEGEHHSGVNPNSIPF
jgi:hypothetical protein